ncbi:DUF305 domain-containing protein [Phytohabitans sp. ZYX-F-186]|uniref:DUF305 domain-containing protein n=1 Tax=Phytohabitans maris TaxID=3071409 RepID=A0ABU0ZBP0_9ACTN|nr:DUF305 domain-containing protein [Phytohabitans sp. ZYX-F-186]MDQ7904467.1 DUF305 domain-containing protein [Phytohabitans sp. ZYX-F-186]
MRVVLVVLVFALAACGAEATSGAPTTAPPSTAAAALPATVDGAHNATDVMFLQMMLAHHEPAAALLELGRSKATRADVRGLAGDLATAQATETRTITGWLESWGEPLVSTAHAGAHAAHGGLPALGDKEVAELERIGGAEFDTAFLNMLIGHQHGAVELARMEATSGQNPQVKALAKHTDETTRAQIRQLLRMVAG